MNNWTSLPSSHLPPDETPVLIVHKGQVKVAEIRWEHATFEETFTDFWFWDCPYNDGQDWEREDVTKWMPLPEKWDD